MSTKIYHGYYECLSADEVADTMKSLQKTMAIQVSTQMKGFYTLSAYGHFNGDPDDMGLEDVSTETFHGDSMYDSTKKLYEALFSNHEF